MAKAKAPVKKAEPKKSAAKKKPEPKVEPYVPKKKKEKLIDAAAKAFIPDQSNVVEPEDVQIEPNESFDTSIPVVETPVIPMEPKKTKDQIKKSKTTKVNVLDPVGKEKEHLDAVRRNYKITAAKIRDGLVQYDYEVTSGLGEGDVHGVAGKGLYKPSMKKAFARLSVHLVSIDQVHKHMGLDVKDIDQHHTDEITYDYTVTGFRLHKGDKVSLIGYKHVPLGGILNINTFKIPVDNNSSYQWYNELKTEIERCCEEVCLYREGNYDTVDEDLPDDNHEDEDQTKIHFPEFKENPIMEPGEHPSGQLPHDPNDESLSDVFPNDLENIKPDPILSNEYNDTI
jgi:hypothetical protein